MAQQPKQTYHCKNCKAAFFSYSEMIEHKGRTGHPEYLMRTKWPET